MGVPPAEHPLGEGSSQPLSTSPFPSSTPTWVLGWTPIPGWPVIRGVILAIIQGAIFIQSAGNDQAEFIPWEERAEKQ